MAVQPTPHVKKSIPIIFESFYPPAKTGAYTSRVSMRNWALLRWRSMLTNAQANLARLSPRAAANIFLVSALALLPWPSMSLFHNHLNLGSACC